MDIMSRYQISKLLPDELVDLVEAFFPMDRNQASPTATLISTLGFRQSRPDEFHKDGRASSVVECNAAHFFHTQGWYLRSQNRRYIHSNFDERLHPHHYGIGVVLQRLRRYGELVIRELPDGWEVSADLGRHPTVRMIHNALWDPLWDQRTRPSAPKVPYRITFPHMKYKRETPKCDEVIAKATTARLQNEIEQDRIAKALEPVVAENLMQKLPNVLEDKIRWLAQEPTPSAKCMHELTFHQYKDQGWWGDTIGLVISYPDSRRVMRRRYINLLDLIEEPTNVTEYLQNQLEQDRIAKALEPVVAEHLMQKLPKVLEDKIRWWATEPTPTAKIMKDVSVSWRVFCHSESSPYGPSREVWVNVQLPFRGATFRDPSDPDKDRWCSKTFAIRDIPLDAEPTFKWRFAGWDGRERSLSEQRELHELYMRGVR